MTVIDHHVHLYPDELNRAPEEWAVAHGEGHWRTLCCRRRKDGSPVQFFLSRDALLRAMDQAGVDRAVLLGWYWERAENCVWQNRFFGRCLRAHPDRFSAYATLHAGMAPEAVVAEMERARGEGLSGLGELSPHSQGIPVGSAGLEAALRLAAQWSWPVNFHVTDPLSRPFPGRVETPLADFANLIGRHRETLFVLAHWGGGLDVRTFDKVRVDTAAAPLIYGEGAWEKIGQSVRADQVRFGSDCPLRLYPRTDAGLGWARFVAEARRHGAF